MLFDRLCTFVIFIYDTFTFILLMKQIYVTQSKFRRFYIFIITTLRNLVSRKDITVGRLWNLS